MSLTVNKILRTPPESSSSSSSDDELDFGDFNEHEEAPTEKFEMKVHRRGFRRLSSPNAESNGVLDVHAK